jgi:hypothetical protein
MAITPRKRQQGGPSTAEAQRQLSERVFSEGRKFRSVAAFARKILEHVKFERPHLRDVLAALASEALIADAYAGRKWAGGWEQVSLALCSQRAAVSAAAIRAIEDLAGVPNSCFVNVSDSAAVVVRPEPPLDAQSHRRSKCPSRRGEMRLRP